MSWLKLVKSEVQYEALNTLAQVHIDDSEDSETFFRVVAYKEGGVEVHIHHRSATRDMVLGDPSYSNPPVGGPAGTLARDWMREK